MSIPTDNIVNAPHGAEDVFLRAVVRAFRDKNPNTEIHTLIEPEADALDVVDGMLQHYVKEGKPLLELLETLPKE